MMDISVKKVSKMMDFLSIESYIVPHYSLAPPEPINSDRTLYRSSATYRLFKDGTMFYRGLNDGPNRPTITMRVDPTDTFVIRAYVCLADDCRKAANILCRDNKKYSQLMLRFNGLGFLNNF